MTQKIVGEDTSAAAVLSIKFPLKGLFGKISIVIVLTIGGCKSYDVVPNGFIVQGDDNFVSVEEKFSVSIGSNLLSTEIWEKNSPPLHASNPTSKQKRILRKLGYDERNYAVLFTSSKNLPFQIVGLVNSFPLSSKTKTDFVEIGKLNRKENDHAKWYDESRVINSHQVYHAIVPISEKLFAEKYLSIIYIGESQQSDFELIKEITRTNAEKYRIIGQQYLPMKTVETCAGEGKAKYFDYAVPEVVMEHNQYTLIKAFSEKDKTNAVYYSLLQPGQTLGSFKLCRGRYLIEYTSLSGVILWNEETEVK